jgi:hypothetical protein
MSKEPGALAFEAWTGGIAFEHSSTKAQWAAVEAAVRADERERAAKVAHDFGEAFRVRHANSYGEGYADASDAIAAAIRNLGDTPNAKEPPPAGARGMNLE